MAAKEWKATCQETVGSFSYVWIAKADLTPFKAILEMLMHENLSQALKAAETSWIWHIRAD